MAPAAKKCDHIKAVKIPDTGEHNHCEECIKTGDNWLHLRTCQSCGVTLCCDSSPNRHASKHADSHGHAVAASAEPGEYWMWCYEDKLFYQYQ